MPKLNMVGSLILLTVRQKLTFWGLSGFQENMNKCKHNRQFSFNLKFWKKDLKSSLASSVQMLPSDLHRNISNAPCCWHWGKGHVAVTASRQTATRRDRSHPRGRQPQPHAWESRASKHPHARQREGRTRPLPFTPSFWGFQAYSHRCGRAETHAACSSLGLHLS